MPDTKLETTVYPRGKEGLLAPGPVAPGPGEIPPRVAWNPEEAAADAAEDMETIVKELTPQHAKETAAKVARVEARNTVQAVLEEERQRQAKEAEARKDRLRPFYGFMESLKNLAATGPGGEGESGRTELVMKLYRLENNGGPTPTKIFQTQVSMAQDEALALGDPDFEGRTMAWAREQGVFGRYLWRLCGWADGEAILDTGFQVNVEQPAGYQPPTRTNAAPVEPEPKPDPKGQLKDTLELIGMMKETMGLKGGGGADATQLEILKTAAAAQARLEAANEHRRELRELEDRHRKELAEAEQKGFERGKTEGERILEGERLRWELKAARETDAAPSFAQEVTAILGGPQTVQNLVGGIVSYLNRPKAPAPLQRPAVARPVAPLRPTPTPPGVPVHQAAVNPGQEPTRVEWVQALGELEEGIGLLRDMAEDQEQPADDRAKAAELLPILEAYHAKGLEEGPLAAWWVEWPKARAVLAPLFDMTETDESEGDPGMDLEALKSQLIRRLDEGATDEAILDELRGTVPPALLATWRNMLLFATAPMVAGALGIPERHNGRMESLLTAIKKG